MTKYLRLNVFMNSGRTFIVPGGSQSLAGIDSLLSTRRPQYIALAPDSPVRYLIVLDEVGAVIWMLGDRWFLPARVSQQLPAEPYWFARAELVVYVVDLRDVRQTHCECEGTHIRADA